MVLSPDRMRKERREVKHSFNNDASCDRRRHGRSQRVFGGKKKKKWTKTITTALDRGKKRKEIYRFVGGQGAVNDFIIKPEMSSF